MNALPLLALLLAACVGSADKAADKDLATSDDSSSTEDSPLTGCRSWSNWECTVSSGGCGASCEGHDILCNGGDTCRLNDGSTCAGMTGEGCELCELAVDQCGADWGL